MGAVNNPYRLYSAWRFLLVFKKTVIYQSNYSQMHTILFIKLLRKDEIDKECISHYCTYI